MPTETLCFLPYKLEIKYNSFNYAIELYFVEFNLFPFLTVNK